MKNNYSRNSIVALCSAVYFVSYFSRKDFAAVMAGMLSENVIDKSFAGLIGTLMFVFYGVGQLISGYLGDKIKPKYLIYAGLITTAICNLFMPSAPVVYLALDLAKADRSICICHSNITIIFLPWFAKSLAS